jgi:hypothetical protein
MRSAVLSLTMMTALAVTPALAQTGGQMGGQPGLSQQGYPAQDDMSAGGTGGATMGEVPAPPSHQPMSRRATNLNEGDTRSIISPSLPSPRVGPNADATQYLQAAQDALRRHRTGVAQSALENAETWLLNRSVPQGMANQPDQNPAVQSISAALQALAAGDRGRTMQLIQQAIPLAQQTQAMVTSPGMQMQPGMNGYQGGPPGYQSGMNPGQPGMAGPANYPAGPGMGGPAGYPPGPGGYPANAGMSPGMAPPNGAYPSGQGVQPGMGYPPPPPPR